MPVLLFLQAYNGYFWREANFIMRTAVYDTYVLKKDGSTMHFDIIVPEGKYDFDRIASFGREYLASKNEDGQPLSSKECKFCHIESPGEEVLSAINEKGYYILGFNDIPAQLPADPTRTQLIQHIRAHSPERRFDNFAGITEDELKSIITTLNKKAEI